MDKKAIEDKLDRLVDKAEAIQEPVYRVFEAIEALMDQSDGTDNLELLEFQVDLSVLMRDFYNEMVDIHDRLIEDFEEIEDDLKETK